MIIGISGKMRSGKDTVAEYIIEQYGLEHLKFSMGITEIIEKYGYREHNGVKQRDEYLGVGQGLRGVLGEDIWVKYTLGQREKGKTTVVSDVRQENEFKAIKELGGKIIYVETPEEVQKERLISLGEEVDRHANHETEIIPEHLADFKIVNGGTLEELYEQVDNLMVKIIKSK